MLTADLDHREPDEQIIADFMFSIHWQLAASESASHPSLLRRDAAGNGKGPPAIRTGGSPLGELLLVGGDGVRSILLCRNGAKHSPPASADSCPEGESGGATSRFNDRTSNLSNRKLRQLWMVLHGLRVFGGR